MKDEELEELKNNPPKTAWLSYKFIGVDWAKDSGMNRGDVISRKDNVTEVRFSTVTLK